MSMNEVMDDDVVYRQGDRVRPVVICGPTRTKQSFRDQVDINKIVARHAKTGMVDHLNNRAPFYGDVADVASYQDALNVVIKAENLFNGMSATIRERFNNDPEKMIAFLQDPANLPEAEKLGMVLPKPADGPTVTVPPGNAGEAP